MSDDDAPPGPARRRLGARAAVGTLHFLLRDPVPAAVAEPDDAPSGEASPTTAIRSFWRHLRDTAPTRSTLVFAVGVAAAAVHTMRAALDAAVIKVHPIGVDGRSVNALHDGNDAIRGTLALWADGYARLRPFMSRPATTYATVQTWLELVLVVFTTVLMCACRRALAKRKRDGRGLLVLRAVAYGSLVYLVLGVYNQVIELIVLGRGAPVGFASAILATTGWARQVVLVLAVSGLAVTAAHVVRHDRAGWTSVGVVLRAYRVMILIAGVHAALLLASIPGEQSEDALRLWNQSGQLLLVGSLSTLALGVTLGYFAVQLGKHGRPNSHTFGIGGTVAGCAIGAVLVGLGFAFGRDHPLGPGLIAIGAVVFVVFALSFGVLRTGRETAARGVDAPGRAAKELMPAVLAATPVVVLMVALLRSSVPLVVERGSDGGLIGTAVAAGVVAVAVFVAARASARLVLSSDASHVRWSYGIAIGGVVVAIAFTAWIAADATSRAPELGVIAIMSVFLTTVASVFSLLGNITESRPLPAALDYVGFRRLPVTGALLVIGLVSHTADVGDYHSVSTRGTLPESAQVTVDQAFGAWLRREPQQQPLEPDALPPVRQARPLVFIAAAGGGIKAAAFTASVIDCLFAPTAVGAAPRASDDRCATANSWDDVFVASGASGGSVGIAAAMARASEPAAPAGPDEPGAAYGPPTPEDAAAAPNWVVSSLGGDLLSAPLAWQLMIETPNAVLSFNPDRDRAAVLEDVWRDRLGGAATDDFYIAQAEQPTWTGPYAFFSGTSLADGCRVNVSRVRTAAVDPDVDPDIDPVSTLEGDCRSRRRGLGEQDPVVVDQGDTRDLVDYLCDGENLDLATAAFLSARFPYVSPTGVARCRTAADEPAIAVGDGGYRDNSGASSVVDVMTALDPLIQEYNATHAECIVPVLLEIESGYAGLGASDPLGSGAQLLAPPLGAASVFGDLSYGQIEQAVAWFTRELAPATTVRIGAEGAPVARHVRISLVDHPGVTAPLGWSLSEGAINDFARQLTVPENAEGLTAFRALTGGDLVCVDEP